MKPLRHSPREEVEARRLGVWVPASIVRGPEVLVRQPSVGAAFVHETLYLVRFCGGFQKWVSSEDVRRCNPVRW